jgi:hypothetical protein
VGDGKQAAFVGAGACSSWGSDLQERVHKNFEEVHVELSEVVLGLRCLVNHLKAVHYNVHGWKPPLEDLVSQSLTKYRDCSSSSSSVDPNQTRPIGYWAHS